MNRRSFLIISFLIIVLLTASGVIRDPINPNTTKALKNSPDGSFSIIVIPDTQGYLGKGTKKEPDSKEHISNPVFDSQTQWITKNLKTQKIIFVSHAGDIVDINNNDQWSLARKFMDRLHNQIPYAISVGNHDMTSEGNSSLFQKYFPASRFEHFDWYGGYYKKENGISKISGSNANSFQLLSAEGIDLVILHLECNAPDDVLQWADSILVSNRNRFAIVTTHMFLGPVNKPETNEGYYNGPKGIMDWNKIHGKRGNTPVQLWEKCFSKHENLHIIFSGDQSRTNTMHLELAGDKGNTVHALLSDYMTGPGPLRIYRFLPKRDKLKVISYNSVTDEIIEGTKIVPDKKEHNFAIKIPLRKYQSK